jgi:hypothetical protein
MVQRGFTILVLVLGVLVAGVAMADTSVSWVSPSPGDVCIGTCVTPTGNASGSGMSGGTGLDLMLVIDTSGSMSGSGITAAKNAAIALINALPSDSTQLGIIEYDWTANTYRTLETLTSDRSAWIAAVNALTAGGNTATGPAIQAATAELTSVRAIAGHAKMEVVLSDGYSNVGISPITAAGQAWSAGITVHSVGVPGHSTTEMAGIASAGHGIYTNVTNLADLEGLFAGTAGNLVGLDHINVTMPDGTLYANYPTDGLGNFIVPTWTMVAGANDFIVTAYGTDGTSATATLSLNGVNCSTVPEPATLILLFAAIPAFAIGRKKFRRA